MLTLLSTNDAAQKLGISVQGVHYRIKTNKLKSIVKDGKTFVYIDLEEKSQESATEQQQNNQEIIKVKDEQISFLKRAIRWMGFQHKTEIKRLEQNHNKLIEVFKSEVELLQKAYNEMQNLYKMQNIISYRHHKKEKPETIQVDEFFTIMRKRNKTNFEIKRMILNQIDLGDERFSYDLKKKKITIKNDKFEDLL
ncbi:MAG: DNA-binding protein [Arcobacteraceae bacterium]